VKWIENKGEEEGGVKLSSPVFYIPQMHIGVNTHISRNSSRTNGI
jgi:hypothetical protein